MSMPQRLTVLGDLERPDHAFVPQDASCYFWGEYTSRQYTHGPSWDYSPTNQLISNFKKSPDRKGQPDWVYKDTAINCIATAFAGFWNWQKLNQRNVALVPMPPAKARDDIRFDDRMLQMLLTLRSQVALPLDIRDCLSFSGNLEASHQSNSRASPNQLYADLTIIHEAISADNPPEIIMLFDDVLTTGAHFLAARRKLLEVFPSAELIGQFIARRKLPRNPI